MVWSLICEREWGSGYRFGKLGFGVVSERYGQSVPLLPGKRLAWDLGYSCHRTRVTSQLLPFTQLTTFLLFFFF